MRITTPASPTRVCPRCGTPLAAPGPIGLDAPPGPAGGARRAVVCPCRGPGRSSGPPDLPPEFWRAGAILAACAARHLGQLSVAYRTHPAHGPRLSQARLASWLGLRQSQVSLIENGPPVRDLDRLVHWARTLAVPEWLLWFDLPGRRRVAPVPVPPPPGGPPGDGRVFGGSVPRGPVRGDHVPGGPVPGGPVPGDHVPGGPVPDAPRAVLLDGAAAGPIVEGGDRAHDDLVPWLREWADTMRRREFLRTFGWAATAAGAAPLLADPPLTRAAAGAAGGAVEAPVVDAGVIARIEAVLAAAQRQDDALGPRAALQTVLAQRELVRSILPHCGPARRPRLLASAADVSRVAGWLSFDLRDFDAAASYYHEARRLAEQAGDPALGALVHCQLGLLALWREQPRLAAQHAAGARRVAEGTDDLALRAYTREISARAHARAGEARACLTALDEAAGLLAGADESRSIAYFNTGALLTSVRGRCLVDLHQPAAGRRAIEASLTAMDGGFVRNVAFTQLDLARAHLGEGNVDAAAGALDHARRLATRNHSARLAAALRQTRVELEPWRESQSVRALDRGEAPAS
jgi:hypothetical protein